MNVESMIRETNTDESRDPIEALGEELLDRHRRGESVSVDQYALEYPEWADQIRLQFPVMIALEKFKESSLSYGSDSFEMSVDAPQELGDFHIIREIGRGAMGVVYEAEQQSLQRRVAVKVFPAQTLREPGKLDRFARESKMSAGLHHNNIVPVFGVGQHDGLHYFVMQRIDGKGLDEIIEDAKKFAMPNRSSPQTESAEAWAIASSFHHAATIGVQVADAIHYAHSNGVLHRDIKPSNLMIDANGTVWVSDFGLATVLQEEPTIDRNDIAGTLRFMAPEQLSGKHDTRSDLYSLGVTLYELVTLEPAFVAESKAAVIDRILRGEFIRPREIRPSIPRDLEAIILKAMAVQPETRYRDGLELAADLERFVDGRAVHARRIGPVGRAVRWSRRNPLSASLVSTLAIVICVSFFLVSSKWREAVSERKRAESNLLLALESMDQILGRFTSSWMARPSEAVTGTNDAASGVEFYMIVSDHSASLMEDALRFYDRFAAENAPSPRLQRDTARVHQRAGDIYQRLGKFDEAAIAYTRCLNILEQQDDEQDLSLVLAKAGAINQLGLVNHATSRFVEAEKLFLRAKQTLSAKQHRDAVECQAELARTFSYLGQAQWLMMHHVRARQSHRRSLMILERLVEQRPQDLSYQLALATAYRAYLPFAGGRNHEERNRIKTAGIGILENLAEQYPDVPDYRCELAEMLAATQQRAPWQWSSDLQIEQIQRGIELARELSQQYPTIPRYSAVLALCLKTKAQALERYSPDDANEAMDEAIEIYRSLARTFPDVPAYHILCGSVLRQHAHNLRRTGQFALARANAVEAAQKIKVYLSLRPGNPFGKGMLARLYAEFKIAPAAEDPTASQVEAASQAESVSTI